MMHGPINIRQKSSLSLDLRWCGGKPPGSVMKTMKSVMLLVDIIPMCLCQGHAIDTAVKVFNIRLYLLNLTCSLCV